jgi:hypothetical protein
VAHPNPGPRGGWLAGDVYREWLAYENLATPNPGLTLDGCCLDAGLHIYIYYTSLSTFFNKNMMCVCVIIGIIDM